MANVGEFNRLKVVKEVGFGVYVESRQLGNILLPKKDVPSNTSVGDWLDVFIYLDSSDQLIATTQQPLALVGDCACLKVTEVNDVGAFLDWGLSKNILVPFREQHKRLQEGKSYVVSIYQDEQTERIVASTRLSRHLSENGKGQFQPNEPVSFMVWGRSDMGVKVVIEHSHLGLVFRDDELKPLKYGKTYSGFIKQVRPDGKLDVCLQRKFSDGQDDLMEKILANIQKNDGRSFLTDKSAADDIFQQYHVSKNNYKKALGRLYKAKKIRILSDCIELV